METEYQRTLHFCDANVDERKAIYENIGFTKVSMNLALNEKSKAKKDAGIDAIMMDERFRKMVVKEMICKYPYSNMLEKKFPVELYSDFEEGKPGWGRTASADTVFYFFIDAIVSVDMKMLRDEYLDVFTDDGTAEETMSDLAFALFQNGVSGKKLLNKENADVYVSKNGDGHHSVGLMIHPDSDFLGYVDYLEYYFEDEPDEDGTDEEETDEE